MPDNKYYFSILSLKDKEKQAIVIINNSNNSNKFAEFFWEFDII